MAYITTEQVSKMREQIKKEFSAKDGFKFSITREHYSGIRIIIREAPFRFHKNIASMKRYYVIVPQKPNKHHVSAYSLVYSGVPTGKKKILWLTNVQSFFTKMTFSTALKVSSWYKDSKIVEVSEFKIELLANP